MTKKVDFKPMLCASFKGLETFQPPYYVSYKLDGVRCLMIDGVALSRKLIPFPNKLLQLKAKELYSAGYNYLDGELIIGDILDKLVFTKTSSCVNSIASTINDLKYYVFDIVENKPFFERIKIVNEISHPFIKIVEQNFFSDINDILRMEEDYLSKGGEGLICKSPVSPYKYGRSTIKENYALKLKRFMDSEAKIIGMEPLYSNQNDAVIDDLGYIKRSSKQDGLVIKETMGALLVEDVYTGVQFNIGSGFTADLRNKMWQNKEMYINKFIKYKYFPVGVKEKPRFPVFLTFVSMNFK